jgi:hypothetical protein
MEDLRVGQRGGICARGRTRKRWGLQGEREREKGLLVPRPCLLPRERERGRLGEEEGE